MSQDINKYILGESLIYSATYSPYRQGASLAFPWQMFAYTNLKIRGNEDFIFARDLIPQTQEFFDDSMSFENLGVEGTKDGSQVSLDTHGQVTEVFNHSVSKRDLGQTVGYEDGQAFEESDPVDPVTILDKDPFDLFVPIELVQKSGLASSFDGVIEPFTLRRIIDLTSVELPFIFRSVKGDNSNTNPRRESITVTDSIDLRDDATRPFLDATEHFGPMDIPGVFSDATPTLAPFVDNTEPELFYGPTTSLDAEISNVLYRNGLTAAGVARPGPSLNSVGKNTVVARHGFDFSQNDNFGYDSIVYGGLKK